MKYRELKRLFNPGRRSFGENVRQLKGNWAAFLFGIRCPLCDCKDLGPLKKKSYLDYEICQGCSIDLSAFAHPPNRKINPQIEEQFQKLGLTYEEFCRLENGGKSS
jgi:hypothetical protein